ncbi:hypothetical protein BD410DRAFT_814636 [Rickenella mellea]|uniref:Probable 26S proteasome regulatory subunit p27 n=1 Tax=Rickenella mellea TaxID=50990 RepID=A0A4Y7Q6X5_9AGAM|nr:hypothetical protein BD410DRAFT_814636 [Rickenella mellea]
MGFMLPSPTSPAEIAKALVARRDVMQTELDAQFSILRANESTMNTPLLDPDGFPRADIDVFAVRHARVRIIELRNDLEAIMNDIGKALEGVYSPALASAATTSEEVTQNAADDGQLKPFARVDGIFPGSPASEAGLQREDLLLRFGDLTAASFVGSSLTPLSDLVARHENRALRLVVRREGNDSVTLSLTPRKGWGGRGLLGCHIVPYTQ